MPTTVTKIIDPSNGPGTDYTSLSAWEAGRQADLVAGDRIEIAECRSTSGTADTTVVTVAGWTTDATRYPVIQSSGANKHNGIWDATKYRLDISSVGGIALTVTQNYVRIIGIQIRTSSAGSGIWPRFISQDSTVESRIANCIFKDDYTGSSGSEGIMYNGGSGTHYVYDNLFLENAAVQTGTNGVILNWANTSGTIYVENNTFINVSGVSGTAAINNNVAGSVIARNNIALGFGSTATWVGTFTAGTDNNVTDSSDAIGAGSNNRIGQTFRFTNAAGGDYSLAPTDGGARYLGTTLAGVSSGFTDDIIGAARRASGAIDCGCFERQYYNGVVNGSSSLCGVSDGFQPPITTSLAVQTNFGSLSTYTYPSGYDKNKLGLGPLMAQSSGTGENNWVGPFPINVARPVETPGARPGLYPAAINWSSTYDWVFLADGGGAAATRTFQLYRFNKTNITTPWSWIGYINCTIPFAGTQGVYTVTGLAVSYEKYTTGTVSINNGSASLTGSGTTWSADRIFLGSRIGFGSTDASLITVWYEISAIGSDTSITLTQNFGESNISGASYVIEDLRLLWNASNGTTASNAGLFMTAGLRYENFTPGGITISAAATTDKVRATYWLTDGNATNNATNQTYGGIVIDAKTSWTNQRVYSADHVSLQSRFQVNNFRAAMTVGGGLTQGRDAATNTFVFNTGQQATVGNSRLVNNLVLCTPAHGPRNGVKSLFWVTSSRIYSAEINNITSGSTNFQSGAALEIPPGGSVTNANIGNFSSLSYDSLADRFLLFTLGARSYLARYREDGIQWDRNILTSLGQINQSIADTTVAIWPNNLLVAGFTGCVLNGMSYIISTGTVATSNHLYNVPYAADWEYASSTNCRVVLPVMDTTDFSQFIAGFVSPIEVIGGKIGNNLGIEPGAVRFYYRTSGINDNSGDWTLLDYTGNMEQITATTEIQGMIEFRTITIQALPARVSRAGFIGLGITLTSDSHFQLSQKHTDINNKLFAFRYSQAFGGTVPTLYLRIYDGVNSNLLISDDSVTQAGTWEKTVNDGASWTSFNTSDRANEITYLRFTPASIADDVEVLPTVRLS